MRVAGLYAALVPNDDGLAISANVLNGLNNAVAAGMHGDRCAGEHVNAVVKAPGAAAPRSKPGRHATDNGRARNVLSTHSRDWRKVLYTAFVRG